MLVGGADMRPVIDDKACPRMRSSAMLAGDGAVDIRAF
jgi:hypothetical protein